MALVHADQNSATLDSAIRSLAATGSGLFLLGGIGSSRGDCLQIANQVVSGGVSGTFFSPNVAVVTRLSQGCSPIGPMRTVTAGTRNIIQGLDGRPALDVFKEDIGDVLARDLRRVAGYIFAGFQVQGFRHRRVSGAQLDWHRPGEWRDGGRRARHARRQANVLPP